MHIETVKSRRPCSLWHRWVKNKNFSTSITTYSECSRCLSRKAEQVDGIYQPLRRVWLDAAKGAK